MDNFLTALVLSNRWSYRIGRHLLFWMLCVLFFVFIYGRLGKLSYPVATYVEAIIFLPAHMFLSYSIIYFLIPRYLFTGKYLRLVFGIIIFIVITAIISFLISQWWITPYREAHGMSVPTKNFFIGFLAGLRGSNTVAGFATAIKLVKYWYFKKEENTRLEKEKLQAELELLKGQVHPHFLFNTLNNLYSLILQRSEQAPEVVLKLSSLLHYVLRECQQSTIGLVNELAILNHYISLEQIRFGDRLDLSFHVEGDLNNKMIAPLMLLPLVENSFKHGANEMIEQPWISISVSVSDNQLKCKVINGKPIDETFKKSSSSGTGLQNLRKRLALIYPERHELRITREAESFTANLIISIDEHP